MLLDLTGFDYEHQGYTNKMIQQLMFRQKGINNRPGEKMLYSNTNYVLLALFIERISGMEIHEFAKKELFEPLGMTHTFYRSDLEKVIKSKPDYLKIFGAVLDGDNIVEMAKPNHGIILIGSEAHGISKRLIPLIDKNF